MPRLVLASLLWAASFGLIARHLAHVDATLVATLRLFLCALVFAPWLPRGARALTWARLLAVGAVQFGLMYLLYIRAYASLAGHEVALFTVATPLHVALLEGALARRFAARAALGVLLVVAGAAVLQWQRPRGAAWDGFLLVQAANLAFAAGQVAYRRVQPRSGLSHGRAHAVLFLGALVASCGAVLVLGAPGLPALTRTQWAVLGYLGLVPSALAFYLWNSGATRVQAGTLAALNDLKVPLAIGVAVVVFGEASAPPAQLLPGLALFAAGLWLAREPVPERTSGPRKRAARD
jgi:drug/metabolite transporter (DMT)-like permease